MSANVSKCDEWQFTRLPGLLLIWQSGTVDSWQRLRSFLLQKGSLTFSQTCRGHDTCCLLQACPDLFIVGVALLALHTAALLGHAAALVHHAALGGGGGVQGPAGGLARVVAWRWPGCQLYTWPLTLLAGLQGKVARLARVVACSKLGYSIYIMGKSTKGVV